MKKFSWKDWYLKYFDWNNDGNINWWEYLIPFIILISIELIAEIIAQLILKLL